MPVEMYWAVSVCCAAICLVAGAVAQSNKDEFGLLFGGRRISARLFVALTLVWLIAFTVGTLCFTYAAAKQKVDPALACLPLIIALPMVFIGLGMLVAARHDSEPSSSKNDDDEPAPERPDMKLVS